jgi:ferredoxin-nitrite reductase
MNTPTAERESKPMVSPPTKLESPIKEINGETLTGEQQAYLAGWLAGLRDRGVSFADFQPVPAPASPSKPDLSTLIFEERVKKELHPLDSYPLLLENAATGKAPERENTYRFKWHGLFFLTPVKEAFMARLRIPGGVLQSFQLREIARIARVVI